VKGIYGGEVAVCLGRRILAGQSQRASDWTGRIECDSWRAFTDARGRTPRIAYPSGMQGYSVMLTVYV